MQRHSDLTDDNSPMPAEGPATDALGQGQPAVGAGVPPCIPVMDVMASGVHDAKNVVFDAQSRLAAARRTILDAHPHNALALLDEVASSLDLVGRGLTMALAAYQLERQQNPVVLLPTVICDLLEEAALTAGPDGRDGGLRLCVTCGFGGLWLLDRELVAEVLNNAIQNARRFARSSIFVGAELAEGGLRIVVEDDGPGFRAGRRDGSRRFSGVGLQVGYRIAALHERNGIRGRLDCFDRGKHGGAVFALWLPG